MTAIIIEDEPLIARDLQKKIERLNKNVDIIAVLSSLKMAKKWFSENVEPNLILMDIQLSDGVSFELFDYFTIRSPIIFTTAYDEYAIRAFKVNGIDYLLKPIDNEELSSAIDKCKAILELKEKVPIDLLELIHFLKSPKTKEKLYKEKFLINVRGDLIPLHTKDISYILRDTINYVHTLEGQKYIIDNYTMEEMEEILNPNDFFRANRQCIVNVEAILTIKPHHTQKLSLVLKPAKAEQDISREKAPSFKKWFDR